MSTKKYSIPKHWFTTGSVAFVVSCGFSLPFTQNLAQSVLVGLAAIPGVAVSTILRSRHSQQQINRQLERGKLRLHELHHLGGILTEQLQLKHKERQAIESSVSQLQSLATNLTDRIDIDRQQCQQLEKLLSSLNHYCQEQQLFATKLDRKIQEKQARSLEIDTKFNSLKVELSRSQAEIIQTKSSADQAKILLRNIHSEINNYSNIKQELERQNFSELESQLKATESELELKLAQLGDLSDKIISRNNEIETIDRDLKTAKLELSSKQAELDNLEFKIHTKLQSIADLNLGNNLRSLEPKPPNISRNIKKNLQEEWHTKFSDNPHLTILQHIEKHGTITEAEASRKLGNARSVRQFANKLEEYTQDLPFSIRVESSTKGNRYIKEI